MKVCSKCEAILPDKYDICPSCGEDLIKNKPKTINVESKKEVEKSDLEKEAISPFAANGDLDDFAS